MPILTKEQKEAYNADQSKCPFCGSEDINGGHMEVDGGSTWQEVDCNKCGESWQDVYTYSGIYHNETEDFEAQRQMAGEEATPCQP